MRMILYLVMALIISLFSQYIIADVRPQEITQPVIVTGKHLSSLLGKDINRLRVFAFSDNKFTVIPFQIDQRTAGGNWVWDVALKGGEIFDTDDPPGTAVFDANDQLIFMLRDIGSRVASPYVLLKADLILELDITDRESGLRGWVYIAYFQGTPLIPIDFALHNISPR